LNQAIAAAVGRYIARMDADDVALPQRFERQVAVLAAQPSVAVVGSFVQVIDAGGRRRQVRRFPSSPATIAAALERANCIAHPTVMMRRDAVLAAGGYRAAFRQGEDYDLWLRLAERHDFLNLDEILLLYRDHAGQASWRDIEQRILTELGARVAARHRRSGRPDPATGWERMTRAFLLEAGVAEAELAAALTAGGIGAAHEAISAGHRVAARAALALVLRQPGLHPRTWLHCRLMQARAHLP
jgi:glycosyltransferase involved in cell wall biosynthesis